MGAEQSKGQGREELPFKGVPSDQVGRGSGQDPQDMADDDQPECEALQKMRREFKEEEQQRARSGAVSSGGRSGGSGSAGGDEAEIGSIQRPPADS